MPASIECKECGLFHPPVAPGCCPMANSKEANEEAIQEHGNALVELSIEVQKAFLKRVGIFNNPEKQKELAKKLIVQINSLQ